MVRKRKNGKQKTATCTVCEQDEAVAAEKTLCRNCYATFYRWRGRSVGALMERKRQLSTWTKRNDVLTSGRRNR